MKEEIIRFENVTKRTKDETVLDNLNFYMMKGEVTALLSLQDQGKREFLELFEQNQPIDYGKIYLDGIMVNSYAHSDLSMNKVSVIREQSGLVDALSVADNLFVMRKGFKKYVINEAVLRAQMIRFLDDLGFTINFDVRINSMRRLDRVIVEIAKAILSGHQLIVLNHISNVLSQVQLLELFELIRRLKRRNLSFLYVCNHHEEAFQIADRAALFSDGRIIKLLEHDELTDEAMAPYIISFTQTRNPAVTGGDDLILRFNKVEYEQLHGLSFGLKRGECLTLLDTDYRAPKKIVRLLTGEDSITGGSIEFDGSGYDRTQALRFLDRGIAVIPPDPLNTYLFYEQTYMENLTFLLDKKLGKSLLKPAFLKSIRREYRVLAGDCIDSKEIRELDARQLYGLVYYRVRLYHPKLAVLVQPVANGDMYCRRQIIDLIQSLKDLGISILILASSVSDNLMVSDRLIVLKDGAVIAEYQEEEFCLISRSHI